MNPKNQPQPTHFNADAILLCKMGCFRLRYGLFQELKRAVLKSNMARLATH